MLLFETFGGWSPPVVALFKKMRDKVQNKLTKKQYEDKVTWLVDADVAGAHGAAYVGVAAPCSGVGDRGRAEGRGGRGGRGGALRRGRLRRLDTHRTCDILVSSRRYAVCVPPRAFACDSVRTRVVYES